MRCLIWLSIVVYCGFAFAATPVEQTFTYDDQDKRDPFRPLVDKDGRYLSGTGLSYSSEGLKLSGILWDPQGQSSALINNQVVQAGDALGSFTIESISKNSVTISKDGRQIMLRLNIEEEKER